MSDRISARIKDCPLRRNSSCGDIDVALGWSDALSMQTCDGCWKLGGPNSENGRMFRQRYVEATVSAIVEKGLEHYSEPVVAAVLGKHRPEEAAALRARMEAAPKPDRSQRWLGVKWEGVPMPKRPVIAGKVAARAFVDSWRALRTSGCGCIKALKDRVRR